MPRMAQLRIEHTFNCSADTFWEKIFFDSEYNERLFKDVLRFPEWKVVKNEDRGPTVERVVEVTPRIGELPAPLKKAIGDGVRYREEGSYDKAARRYRMNVVPNKLSDKMVVRCELWLEPAATPNQCRRLFTCQVEAKIFGVGGILEKRLIEDMEKSQNISAEFTNRFIAEKGL